LSVNKVFSKTGKVKNYCCPLKLKRA
jgi:hypothetical protein